MSRPGLFITFEGIDGSGKTTQLSLAVEWLRGLGREVVATKEPGGTELGLRIREIVLNPATGRLTPESELGLMFAARAQHLAEVIHPSLEAGKVILCDRFTDSTLAYQGFGRGVSPARIASLDQILCQSFKPDLTLLLDIDPAVAFERANGRNSADENRESRFEAEGLAFLQRVREGFNSVAEREPERVRKLDARGSVANVQREVQKAIAEALHGI